MIPAELFADKRVDDIYRGIDQQFGNIVMGLVLKKPGPSPRDIAFARCDARMRGCESVREGLRGCARVRARGCARVCECARVRACVRVR